MPRQAFEDLRQAGTDRFGAGDEQADQLVDDHLVAELTALLGQDLEGVLCGVLPVVAAFELSEQQPVDRTTQYAERELVAATPYRSWRCIVLGLSAGSSSPPVHVRAMTPTTQRGEQR